MKVISRSDIGGHLMLTIGNERAGVRLTPGKLDRHGRFHDHWPDVFLLWRGRRVTGRS